MMERRRHDRSRDFAPGTIAFGRTRATLDCVVRNLSAGGALLLLDEPCRAPQDMDLAMRGGTRSARVVWRGATEIGVRFAAAEGTPLLQAGHAVVISLDAARRDRGSDAQRLADRIVRFVRRPDRV